MRRVIDGQVFDEPDVIINGHTLTFAEAMTLRVLVSISELAPADPQYAPHVAAIARYIHLGGGKAKP